MNPIFLDSAFLIALVLRADQNHASAIELWEQVTRSRRSFITTTLILNEVVTFLNNRGDHSTAVAIGTTLLNSPAIEMVEPGRTHLTAAWDYFVRHSDKSYSLTDCISFVIMRERSLTDVLTYDAHFTQAGFQRILSTA